MNILEHTESSPHPVSLSECIDGDWKAHGGHHAEVREGQVHHEHVGRGPQVLHLQEDVADAAIAKEVDHPQEEEADANNVVDKRMLGWEGSPMFIDNL